MLATTDVEALADTCQSSYTHGVSDWRVTCVPRACDSFSAAAAHFPHMKLIFAVAVLMLLSVSRAFVQPALAGTRSLTKSALRMVRVLRLLACC